MPRLLLGLLMLGSALAGAAYAAPMARIPGGSYLPFYTLDATRKPVKVRPFELDIYPVTNQDYLSFVKAQPKWQRSRITRLFADKQYLARWQTDLSFAPALASSPVTHVSWFAAQAYCQAQGKQLPSIDQWEFAARASASKADASQDPAFAKQILSWYAQPTPSQLPAVGRHRNLYGVYDLHGLVWEWPRDFNSIIISNESREKGVNRDLYCASGSSFGADPSDYAAYMRFAFRSSLKANYTVANLGFRCAKEVL